MSGGSRNLQTKEKIETVAFEIFVMPLVRVLRRLGLAIWNRDNIQRVVVTQSSPAAIGFSALLAAQEAGFLRIRKE